MMKNKKVVGLGQCALDYLFVVDSFPAQDTKKEVIRWTVCGGGPVATALAGLSRLGIECSFHGIVGDDDSGRKIRESLKKENINVKGLLERPGSISQTAFIGVERGSGKRTIFWKRPSGEPMKPDEIPNDFLENSDFLLLDGLMSEASLYAATMAKKKNIPIMLDSGKVRQGMIELASMCDYIVASEEFGKGLIKSGHPEPAWPEKALSMMVSSGTKSCTITLGDRGSITLSNGEFFCIPAHTVKTVDTTGAGDIFHAGYIYGILQGWNLKDVVRFATVFAGLKCRKLGGRAGIPTLSEVQELLGRGA
jgi:ribokinase